MTNAAEENQYLQEIYELRKVISRLKRQIAEYDDILCRRCGFNIKFEMFEGEGLMASCAKCESALKCLIRQKEL